MKAIICPEYGPPEVLKLVYLDKPIPKSDEILIRIKATAVNSADIRIRGLKVEGLMKIIIRLVLGITKPRKPILGVVLSGVVEQVGENTHNFKLGDEIYAMTGLKFGAYAEYITLKYNSIISFKPKKASYEESAAIIFGGSTAIYFLEKANIKSGNKNVLIYGATGSVGSSAVQIAKYYNNKVTAVCGEDGVALTESLGVDNIIIYNQEDFTKSGIKYDIIFDAVGKIQKKDCLDVLSEKGMYITVGGIDVATESKEQLEFLANLYDKGKLKPVIDKVYSLTESDIIEAHRYVDSGKKKGNVVISI